MEKAKKRRWVKISAAVLSVLLALLTAALIFAGNFLFEFALYPEGSFTMKDLFQQGGVTGIDDASAPELSPERQAWRDYSAQAREWYASRGGGHRPGGAK